MKKKMNLPNRLTVIRLCLVPVFVTIMLVSDAIWASIVGLLLFITAAVTDMMDGKMARKHHLITDFGKFMDPLADKFMVIGALFVIFFRSTMAEERNDAFCTVFLCAFLIVVFRELAVTSIRLVVSSSSGIVVAANMLGKIKTCMQIACVIACIVEPVFYTLIKPLHFLMEYLPLSFLTTAGMMVFTLWSGLNYILSYWKYLDPEK